MSASVYALANTVAPHSLEEAMLKSIQTPDMKTRLLAHEMDLERPDVAQVFLRVEAGGRSAGEHLAVAMHHRREPQHGARFAKLEIPSKPAAASANQQLARTALTERFPRGHVACMPADMESPTIYADTLRIAAESVGGSRNLARRLGVAPDELALWISGRQAAPLECFVTALDIIGERPYLNAAIRRSAS